MLFKYTIFLLVSVLLKGNNGKFYCEKQRKFPDKFIFGAATSAYQIEGGWNADGKGENTFDRLSHAQPCVIQNCDTGNVAANSYYNYKRDVEMARDLGLDFYRFSISWSRILPTGFPNVINKAGIDYYNNLINELLDNNIEPMVTIFHFDIPQILQDLGGWNNPDMASWFLNYARILFDSFGDRVKNWFTVNEPREFCNHIALFVNASGIAEYLCAKNMLIGHAKAYHLYNNEYRPKQNGKISIVLNTYWYEPENEKDKEAAKDMLEFNFDIYAHPIYSKTGDWPPGLKKRIAQKSAEQGLPTSRLPELSADEIALLKGSSDYFALNHYTTSLVYRNTSVEGLYRPGSFDDDIGAVAYQPDDWEKSNLNWLKVVPWGFKKLLNKIRENYDNPPLYVTENGYPSTGNELQDERRVNYLKSYLNAMLDAIDEGSDIRAYTVWSLMDNLEWLEGYSQKFGIYEVDFDSPEKTRTPRQSAYYYKEIIKSRTLNV